MLMFRLENFDSFLDALYLLHQFSQKATIECSPSTFSLIVRHHYLEVYAAFQVMPQYFNHYLSNNTHLSKILLEPLFHTLKDMHEYRIPSLEFFVFKLLDRILLKFYSPSYERPFIRKIGTMWALKEEDMENVDMAGIFFSIDSRQFRNIVTQCRDYFVRVASTHSQVKFTNNKHEFIFKHEARECIIEGFGQEEEETEFLIPIYPTNLFYNITFQAERIWFFKSIDKKGTFLIAPVGLFAQFAIYFPLG